MELEKGGGDRNDEESRGDRGCDHLESRMITSLPSPPPQYF